VLISGSVEAQLVYALAWLSFSVGHSLLASDNCKRRLRPMFGASYRVFYNAFAAIHLGLVWWLGDFIFRGRPRFDFSGEMHAVLLAVYAVGWLIMLLGLKGYDLGRLAGIHQIRCYLRGTEDTEDEPLRLDGLHRYVRHPLYLGGFLILWGRVTGEFEVATAVWTSLYLLVGTMFEERRLLRLYGADYAEYRRRVPAFIPWKGRAF
jgi:hypothetical protein